MADLLQRGKLAQRRRQDAAESSRVRNAVIEPAPAASARFQSLESIVGRGASRAPDSQPATPTLGRADTGFSFEPSAPTTPITPVTPTSPFSPSSPTRTGSDTSSIVRGGKHAAPVQIDWASARKVVGRDGEASIRSSLSDLDREHATRLDRAALPGEVAALEARSGHSAGLTLALERARHVESSVADDLHAARHHVTKQMSRSVSELSREGSLLRNLFINKEAATLRRRATFDEVHGQARSHYHDRVGGQDQVGEIFRARDKALAEAVVAGFKAEPQALDQANHALWELRDLIAPGLDHGDVAAKLKSR